MLDDRVVRVKVTGDYACFTRPDLKVERMTYPCMTPSAARGVLDSILWKPEFQWYVRRIIVLNPVRFMSVKRNEIKTKQNSNSGPIVVDEVMESTGKPKHRVQRNSIILRDVAYIIEASIFMKDATKQMYEKYVGMTEKREGMFPRRVRKGQCWRRPYLGTREFSAEFMRPDENDQPIQETIPVGSMLFDIFYDEAGKRQPLFFEAAIQNGVLDCEVPENDQMMRSSHIQTVLGSEVSSSIYEFNLKEEGDES